MNLIDLLSAEWREFLDISGDYFNGIEQAIAQDSINPEIKNIFKAFQILPTDVKVVIVGQDPYPNSEDAVGLAFSVQENRKVLPASLRNIRKELESDVNIPFDAKGDLTPWL